MAAAVREVREETNIDIAPLGVITVLDAITRDKKKEIEFHYTIVEVVAEWHAGEAKAADDALAVQWASLDDVEKLCAWPEVARVVRLSMLQRVL
jgi:ADP-ribose pyrophosphatase YjhB (NUDIX family)